ncbi:Uncharacterised protein [Mycobacteroides abscessus subsp. abscessus]|nr:Uncharacterised protein [Mycobacteroides abscessus subsp. abscessus]
MTIFRCVSPSSQVGARVCATSSSSTIAPSTETSPSTSTASP